MEFDEVLNKYIGPFGRYQAVVFMAHVLHPLPYFVAVQEMVFQGVIPNYYCVAEVQNHTTHTRNGSSLFNNSMLTSTKQDWEYNMYEQFHMINSIHPGNSSDYNSSITAFSKMNRSQYATCNDPIFNDSTYGITLVETVSSD